MAKKKETETTAKVFCKACIWGGEIEGLLMDCSNTTANPGGYKVGVWGQICKHYKERKNGNKSKF